MTELAGGRSAATSGPAERALTGMCCGTFRSGTVLRLSLDVGDVAACVILSEPHSQHS